METKVTLKSKRDISVFASEYKLALFVDDVAVAYLKLLSKPEYEGMASLCTIETRPGFQGKGYGSMIIAEASKATGLTIGTTGGFTPEGFKAFSGKLPRILDFPVPTKPTFESMTFIDDWDKEFRYYV
jgi:hypothetical protein